MNKRDILAELKISLYYDYSQQWSALFKGDTEARHKHAAIAEGKITFAHALLGHKYYHDINNLAESTERAASSKAA